MHTKVGWVAGLLCPAIVVYMYNYVLACRLEKQSEPYIHTIATYMYIHFSIYVCMYRIAGIFEDINVCGFR